MSVFVSEKLKEFIFKKAEGSGFEVLELIARGGRVLNIEIIMDKKGGITLDECGAFNRELASWIDANSVLEGEEYSIDVCSPGLDRELKTDRDFAWANGRSIIINIFKPIAKFGNMVSGKLLGVSNGEIEVETESGENIRIARENITKVRLKVILNKRGER